MPRGTDNDARPVGRQSRSAPRARCPTLTRGLGIVYTFASGGLGWNLPAAVGIALAERESGRNRPVVAIIGDGSFQYSVQSIWSAARLGLPILIVVMRNGDYAILKSFAELELTPRVPGLALPGLDAVSIAKRLRVRCRTCHEPRSARAGRRGGVEQECADGPRGADRPGDPAARLTASRPAPAVSDRRSRAAGNAGRLGGRRARTLRHRALRRRRDQVTRRPCRPRGSERRGPRRRARCARRPCSPRGARATRCPG